MKTLNLLRSSLAANMTLEFTAEETATAREHAKSAASGMHVTVETDMNKLLVVTPDGNDPE